MCFDLTKIILKKENGLVLKEENKHISLRNHVEDNGSIQL